MIAEMFLQYLHNNTIDAHRPRIGKPTETFRAVPLSGENAVDAKERISLCNPKPEF